MNEITTFVIMYNKIIETFKKVLFKNMPKKIKMKIVPLSRGILFDMYNENEYTSKRIFKLFSLLTSILNIEYAHLYIKIQKNVIRW